MRFIFLAPYRCRKCGDRFIKFHLSMHSIKKGNDRSLAEYIGLRGRDHVVKNWLVAMFATASLLVVSIYFILRIIHH